MQYTSFLKQKRLKTKRAKYTVALILTSLSFTAIALPAPEYLSVKGFKACFESEQHDTWTSWCMPASKPDTCTRQDWDRLKKMDNPLCQNTPYSEDENSKTDANVHSDFDYDDK